MVPSVTAPITFAVRGLPVAQGSARAFVRGGRAIVATDAHRTNTPLGSWRVAIAEAARTAMLNGPAWTGPVMVSVYFVFPRPKGHYLPAGRTRPDPELRVEAPRFVTNKPDVDKLLRALLDGITDVVIRDDSQVCAVGAWKVYEDADRRPGVDVRISPQAATR